MQEIEHDGGRKDIDLFAASIALAMTAVHVNHGSQLLGLLHTLRPMLRTDRWLARKMFFRPLNDIVTARDL